MTGVWVANDDGTEIVRARDISVASLDYDGNVNVRLAGADGAVVRSAGLTIFTASSSASSAELSDAAGAFLVRGARRDGWLAVGHRAAVNERQRARSSCGLVWPSLAALVLDHRSDVPYAHLERQRVLRVHAAQRGHERDHVLHGAVRQALHALNFPPPASVKLGIVPAWIPKKSVTLSLRVLQSEPLPGKRGHRGIWQPRSPYGQAARGRGQRFPAAGVLASRAGSQTGHTCSARRPLAPG